MRSLWDRVRQQPARHPSNSALSKDSRGYWACLLFSALFWRLLIASSMAGVLQTVKAAFSKRFRGSVIVTNVMGGKSRQARNVVVLALCHATAQTSSSTSLRGEVYICITRWWGWLRLRTTPILPGVGWQVRRAHIVVVCWKDKFM